MLLMLICSVSFAQSGVAGKVTSADGQPVPFAGVVVKGTMNGVATADDGSYVIQNVPSNATLVFSSIGYADQEIAVNGRARIDVVLEPDTESLEEVMVVAYGTAKKSSFTGSAASLGKDKFEMRPVTGVTNALAGTTAGVQVSTANGMPGSAPTIRIRGIGSYYASNNPLIVLDGMPYDNDISSINPNDIESVTVLKDASSTALYGARAANGVVMINTKKGRTDVLSVTASYNVGFTNRQTRDYETLDTPEYMQMYWEAARNANLYNGYSLSEANAMSGGQLLTGMGYNAYNTTADKLFDPSTGAVLPGNSIVWSDDLDWRKYVERTGIRHDANLSISGGSAKSDYYTSIGYTNEEGYWVGSSLTRYSINSNVNSQITKWLKVGTSINGSVKEREGEQTEASGNNTNPFRFIRYVGNIYPVHVHYANGDYYLENGEKVYDFGIGYDLPDGTTAPKRDYMTAYNHAAEAQKIYDGYRRLTLNAKAYAEITFLKDFKFAVNVGLGEDGNFRHSADVVFAEKQNEGTSTKSEYNTTTWTFNQILSYNKDFGKHHVDAMIGHESYDYSYFYTTTAKKGQIVKGDNYELANFTEINSLPNSYSHSYAVEGYLSRVNYDYDNKYFASASFRRDGSSRFYQDVRWGNFWSVGAGWRIDREAFMDAANWVDLLKLRLSYGSVGNDDVGEYYPWMAAYSKSKSVYPAYTQTSLGSTSLTWETSANFDAAIEWGLWKGKFNGEFEFFNRQSSNLLFDIPLPLSAGIDSQLRNSGTMYNRGFEFTFDVDVLQRRNFDWRINGNLTFLKNKITKLPVDPFNSSPHRIEEGHPIYEFYLRQWMGVNPENGYCMYKADLDNADIVWEDGELYEHNGVKVTENIEHAVRDWSGNSMPPFVGGLGMEFRVHRFTFTWSSYFQLGGKFYDSTYASLMTATTGSSSSPGYHKIHVDALNRWQKTGDITDVPRFTGDTDSKNTDASSSTRWLTSSSMFELTNFSLSYDLPVKVCSYVGIKGAKVYCSGDNMYLLAARRGMFPRRNTYSGYDGNSDIYLPARTISFGAKLNF